VRLLWVITALGFGIGAILLAPLLIWHRARLLPAALTGFWSVARAVPVQFPASSLIASEDMKS
jgi:hypothetical protein